MDWRAKETSPTNFGSIKIYIYIYQINLGHLVDPWVNGCFKGIGFKKISRSIFMKKNRGKSNWFFITVIYISHKNSIKILLKW